MREHLLHGKPVTDEQIQAWADETEAGYDLSKLPKPRRGRPPVGDGPGAVIPVRLDASTIAALTARAEAEGITTRSDAIRAAVREWAHVDSPRHVRRAICWCQPALSTGSLRA